MSRRTLNFRKRFGNRATSIEGLTDAIVQGQRASKIKRYEVRMIEKPTTSEDKKLVASHIAVGNTSEPIKPEKAQRIAAAIMRSR